MDKQRNGIAPNREVRQWKGQAVIGDEVSGKSREKADKLCEGKAQSWLNGKGSEMSRYDWKSNDSAASSTIHSCFSK